MLAPVMMDRLYEALAALKASDLTMLVVEQDVERTLALADWARCPLTRSVCAVRRARRHSLGRALTASLPLRGGVIRPLTIA
jgi:hypothetical protein